MDLYIERDALIRGLQRVQGIVERRTTNPALGHVLLSAHDGVLRMTATDTMVTLVADYPANIKSEYDLCVEAQSFFAIARSLSDQTVHLQLMGGTRLAVRSGQAIFHLNILAADEFPPLPTLDQREAIGVRAGDLQRVIKETLFSVSSDDNRYGLNGAHMEEIKGEDGPRLRLVTTDGSRLSFSEAPFTGTLALGRRMLMPRKALSEVGKLVESDDTEWTIVFGERSAAFKASSASGSISLSVRLVDGEFPDYRQVLPAGYKRRVELSRNGFIDALRRVAIVATDRNHSVRFTFESDRVVLSAENLDLGDAREEVPADLEGERMSTGFNIKYFQDLLGATSSDKLSLEMGDVLDPCLVRLPDRSDCLFIVMPMRLD